MLDFARAQVEQLRNARRFGTAANYEKVIRSFSAFLQGREVTFSDLTVRLVEEYAVFLVQRGLVRNSVSFYMRTLRAIHNKAVRHHLAVPARPFQAVYTGVDRTRKRAVSEETIRRLHRLELPPGSRLALARDLFLFSYCARGMAFVDIAYLKKSDVRDDVIHYVRRKTGQGLAVRVEPLVLQIMDRHANGNTPYLFPLLTSTDSREAYAQYRTALNAYNRALRQLADLLPGDSVLTSYTARHTWATTARNRNVPLSVISAGMGHASEQTTRVYLDSIADAVVDAANKEIISGLDGD